MNTNILIVDIETTALNPREGFIVEVGAVSLGLADGSTKIVFDEICREQGLLV